MFFRKLRHYFSSFFTPLYISFQGTPVMVNVPRLLFLLTTGTGILPAENMNTPKELEKDKALRIIKKDVYHIED